MKPHWRIAFTLVELLVIIAVIALLIGILLPAISRARFSSRASRRLSNCRQVGLSMTLYASEYKSWYPLVPVPPDRSLWTNQNMYGGVAGLFSLEQVGDGIARGFGGGTPGGAPYSDGNRSPLLRAYIEDLGILTCPADKQDHAPVGATTGAPVDYIPANLTYPPGGPLKRPRTPVNGPDVINYNVSYLYIAGLRTEEANILSPAPIWGDETDGYDVGAAAWYNAGSNPPGAPSPASIAAGAPSAGRYAPIDNHGKAGANFIFTDGHAEFIKDSVYDTFFRLPAAASNINPRNINLIDRFRSTRVQPID